MNGMFFEPLKYVESSSELNGRWWHKYNILQSEYQPQFWDMWAKR